jgi:hypothetical protein
VLDAIGDKPTYVGPIGSATVAKLVHNMSGYAIVCALAETFTMGVKAGIELDPNSRRECPKKAPLGGGAKRGLEMWGAVSKPPLVPISKRACRN